MNKPSTTLFSTLAALSALLFYSPLSCAYTQKTPIINQQPSTIKTATVQGATELIQRLTGAPTKTIQAHPLKQIASQWLEAYSIEASPVSDSQTWLLNAHYSTSAVNLWLKNNHLKLWAYPRPTITVSLKTSQDVPIALDSPQWKQLTRTAQRLGIPVKALAPITPEQQSLDTQPHPILIGILPESEQAGQSMSWAFYQKGHWSNWASPYSTHFANEALSIVSQHVRTQPTNAPTNPPSAITLSVDHVNSVGDYVHVMQTLQTLQSVNSLTDDGIKNDRLLITLITQASISDIKTTLDKLGMFSTDDAPTQADLNYHFQTKTKVENMVDAADTNQNNTAKTQTENE